MSANHQDVVLIVARHDDAHAQAVHNDLRRKGRRSLIMDDSQFSRQITLSWQFSSGNQDGMLRLPDGEVSWPALRGIWLRREGTPAAPDELDKRFTPFVTSENEWAIRGLWRALDCFVVNDPDAMRQADHKISQLTAAHAAGLRTPPTLVTNDPSAVRAFYEQCGGRLIYKAVDSRSLRHMLPLQHQGAGAIGTLPFRAEDLKRLSAVRHGAHLFQQEIVKDVELRITVIGACIFAVAIHSRQGKGRYDMRLDYAVPHIIYHLPEAVETAVRRLMNSLHLMYGAIDMIVTPEGEHVFLEINPAGQFLWLQTYTGQPLSETLADLLWDGPV